MAVVAVTGVDVVVVVTTVVVVAATEVVVVVEVSPVSFNAILAT